MATGTTSAAEVNPGAMLPFLTPSARGGVIFQAVVGGVSAVAILLLLGHLITVSFFPLFRSALNIRKDQEIVYYSNSAGALISGDMVAMSALPGWKSHVVIPPKVSDDGRAYGVDLEGARVAAGRRASARARELSRQYDKEKRLFRMQLDIFIACMAFSCLIQSVGVLIQAHWAYLGTVEKSIACSVQAAMLSFGDVAAAVWNSIVAIHTFSTAVLGLRMSTLGITIVIVIGWSIPVLMNVIGSVVIARTRPTKPYYNVTVAWCFISGDYITSRVVLHYVPLLFAALIITTMYVLVSLTMRGNLQVTPASRTGCLPRFSFSFRRTSGRKGTSGNTNLKQVAYLRSLSLKMLWYPCVYICLILPSTICSMVELWNVNAPSGTLFFATTLLFSVGLSNAVIYATNIGFRSKRNTLAQSPHPPHLGTQVEIHVGRVTENDVGVVTIGDIGLGGHDKYMPFEGAATGDMKDRTVSQENGYGANLRSSLEQECPYPDAKSPTSATQFMPNNPQNWTINATYHPQYTLQTPARTHNHRRSLGAVVVDRLGRRTSLQERQTPFDSSPHEAEQTVACSQSPISPFRQFGPGTRPLSHNDPVVRNPYHTWE